MLVQGDETGDKPLVEWGKDYIKEKYHKPGAVFLGVVHRLDRPVSGVVVLARTSKALERMNELFRHRETRKTYWALTFQKPKKEADTLVHWLKKDEQKNKTTVYSKVHPDGQRSELSYKLMESKNGIHLLEILPVTGRSHQIRAQLAAIGCSIIGDVKYGAPEPNSDGSICLHARKLEFIHPVKSTELSIEAALPQNDFWNPFR